MILSRVIEALLFSAQKPLSIRELMEAIKGAGAEDEFSPNEFARTAESEVAAALEQLKIEYIQEQRAFQIIEKAEGWQLVTDPALPGADSLIMRPTRKQLQAGLARLQLWVDRTRLVLVKMKLDFPNGDTKTLEFDAIQVEPLPNAPAR